MGGFSMASLLLSPSPCCWSFAGILSSQQSTHSRVTRPPSPSNALRSQLTSFGTPIVSIFRAPPNRSYLKCPCLAIVRAVECRALGATKDAEPKNENAQRKDVGSGRKKVAVFVSGGGSNFKALHQATLRDDIPGDIVVLVTDKPRCRACDYARENNIPIVIFPKSISAPSGQSSMDLITTLRKFEINFLLLAGYLKLLPIELIQAFPRSILNIHPSLLPAFGGKGYYGMNVHKAVIASGARFSGPTVHFVDEKYDTGRILAQRVVPVLANDTAEDLAARVLQEEHIIYVEAAAALCDGRIHWREDKVPIIRKSWDIEEYY